MNYYKNIITLFLLVIFSINISAESEQEEYSVTLYNRSVQYGETLKGLTITLPNDLALPESCINNEWFFIGWSEEEITETTTKPNIIEGTTYNPTKDTKLYAIYKKTNKALEIKNKIIDNNWTADYTPTADSWGLLKNNYIISPTILLENIDSISVKMKYTNATINLLCITKNNTNDTLATCKATQKTLFTHHITSFKNNIGEGKIKFTTHNALEYFGLQISSISIKLKPSYNSNPICNEIQQLTKPTNLTVTNVTTNSFKAQWNNVENATSYILDIKQNESSIDNYPIEINTNEHIVTNLNPATTYHFIVIAKGDNYLNSDEATSNFITTTDIPKYTLSLNYNNDSIIKFIGTQLILTKQYTPILSQDNHNIKFIGWSNTKIKDISTIEPNILAKEGDTINITQDLNLYPIFCSKKIKLNNVDLNVDSQYIVIATLYENKYYALNNNNITAATTPKAIEIQPDTNTSIIYADIKNLENFIWKLKKTTNGFYIQNTNDVYLTTNGDNTSIKTKNNPENWDITSTDNYYTLSSKNTSDRYLLYSNSNIFGNYKKININSQNYGKIILIPTAITSTSYSSTPHWHIDNDEITEISTDNNNINLTIEPKGKLIINSNNATINNLTIKSDSTNIGNISVQENTSLTINGQIIIQKNINNSQLIFSLPFDCKISDIKITNFNNDTLTYAQDNNNGDFSISYYDQTIIAENANINADAWIKLSNPNHVLNANQGYKLSLSQKDSVMIQFLSAPQKTIYFEESTNLNFQDYIWFTNGQDIAFCGWNLIGYPYYNESIDYQLQNTSLITIPNQDNNTYTQIEYHLANIQPTQSFFVQVTETPSFINTTNNKSVPYNNYGDEGRLTLTITDTNNNSDQTTIINHSQKTDEYEIGQDLLKWISYANTPQIYTIPNSYQLAFYAQNINQINSLPIGVYAPKNGEYTFSLNIEIIDSMNDVTLYDHESNTSTNILTSSYTTNITKGIHNNRFKLQINKTATQSNTSNHNSTICYNHNNNVYIENLPPNTLIYVYNSIGKLIKITQNNHFSLPNKGFYIISLHHNNIKINNFKIIY